MKTLSTYTLLLLFACSIIIFGQENTKDNSKENKTPTLQSIVKNMEKNNDSLPRLSGEIALKIRGGNSIRREISRTMKKHLSFSIHPGETASLHLAMNHFLMSGVVWSSVVQTPDKNARQLRMVMQRAPMKLALQLAYKETGRLSQPRGNTMSRGMATGLTFLSTGGLNKMFYYNFLPRLLLQDSKTVSVTRKKENGTNWILLTVHDRYKNGKKSGAELVYVNPETYRVVKIERAITARGSRHARETVEASSFEIINKTAVPTVLQHRYSTSNQTMVYRLENLSTQKKKSKKQFSAWFKDPALPERSDTAPDELLKKIKSGRATPVVYQKFVNSYFQDTKRISNLARGQSQDLDSIVSSLKKQLKNHPESTLLTDLLSSIYFSQNKNTALIKLAASREKKNNHNPFTEFLAGRTLLAIKKETKQQKGRKYLEKLAGETPIGLISRSLLLEHTLSNTKNPKKFASLLQTHTEDTSYQSSEFLLSRIIPVPSWEKDKKQIPMQNWKPVLLTKKKSFVEKMANLSSSNVVMLAAARASVFNDNLSKAAGYYEELVGNPEYHPEINEFMLYRGQLDSKLFDKMEKHILSPMILLHKAGQLDSEEQTVSLIQKALDLYEKTGFLQYRGKRDQAFLEMNLKSLVMSDRKQLARRLLRVLSETSKQFFIRLGRDNRSLVHKAFDDDLLKTYAFSRRLNRLDAFNKIMGWKKGLQAMDMRMRENKLDQSDLHLLCKLFNEDEVVKQWPDDIVEKLLAYGKSSYPDDARIAVRLADIRCLKENYEQAAATYETSLKLMRDQQYNRVTDSEEKNRSKRVAARINAAKQTGHRPEQTFDLNAPIPVRYAFAAKQADKTEQAVSQLQKYRKIFSSKDDLDEIAEAFSVLKKFDLVRQMYQKSFRKEQKQTKQILFQMSTAKKLVDLLKKQKHYYRASLVLQICVEKNYYSNKKIKKQLQSIRKKVDWKRVTREFLNRDFQKLSDEEKKKTKKWIKHLGSRKLSAREKAMQHLKHIGPRITPLIKPHLDDKNPEVKQRARTLIKTFARQAIKQEIMGKDKGNRTNKQK